MTHQVVLKVLLTLKQKFCFSMKSLYENATLILMSTKPREQPDVSRCTVSLIFQAAESRGVLRRLQQELRPLHRRRHRQVARGRQEGRGRPVRAGPVPDPGTVRSVQRSQVRI